MTDTTAEQPLKGVRVVEIGTSVAAPYAAWILAALGAEVVKVEIIIMLLKVDFLVQ